MNNYFINTYKKRPLIISKSEGSYLVTDKGTKYLDFLSGISINNIGYTQKKIVKKIKTQVEEIIHPSNYYYTKAQINLAKKLIKLSGLDKVFFGNSGTEANEAALMFLSKYCQNKPTNKNELITFDGTFLGRTFGCRSVAAGQSLDILKVKKVDFNNFEAFSNAVTENTLAVHMELVFGHGGIKPFSVDVVNKIVRLCKEKDILIYIDEVQAGLGRTGDIFTYKIYGIDPDIVTIGKSLGGGIPLSATIVKDNISQYVKPGDYGSTMGGNSLACVAGSVILDFVSKQKNLQMIRGKGKFITDQLTKIMQKYPEKIKDIRGLGMMIGVEVEPSIAETILQKCLENHLLLDTVSKNVLRLLPPFTITKSEIIGAIKILENAIKNA